MEPGIFIAQYRAALAMLRAAVEACPKALWSRASDDNPFWQIAYHALFYTHLYLSHTEDEFEPWEKHVEGYPHLGRLPRPLRDEPKIGDPYRMSDVLEYCDAIERRLADQVTSDRLDAASDFPWLSFTRSEVHVYNLRHIQHHAGQLIERLRQATGAGIEWIGTVA